MKRCPFCTADLPEGAVKCRYCGEWVDGRPPSPVRDPGQSINLRWHTSKSHLRLFKHFLVWQTVASVIFLMIFLAVVLGFVVPAWNRMANDDPAPKDHPGQRQPAAPRW